MAAVFGPSQDGESENVDGTSHALSVLDPTRKAIFFGYFLLLVTAFLALRAGYAVRAFGAVGQQKKVPRPLGRNGLDLFGRLDKAKAFRLSASHFSLLAPAVLALRAGFAVRAYGAVLVQRKVTKRKHLPRHIAQAKRISRKFSDSPSMARSENGGHPWPPPSGFVQLQADRAEDQRRLR